VRKKKRTKSESGAKGNKQRTHDQGSSGRTAKEEYKNQKRETTFRVATSSDWRGGGKKVYKEKRQGRKGYRSLDNKVGVKAKAGT